MSKCAKMSCTAGWPAGRRCHCSDCHQSFGGLALFDKHHAKGPCLSGEEMGLVWNPHGYWGQRDEQAQGEL